MSDDAGYGDEIPVDELLAGLTLDENEDWGDDDDREGDSAILGVTVVNWRELPADEAEAAWTELDKFVSWLCTRYSLDKATVPDCWWKHGGTVEELSALHACWQSSFDASDSGYGPIGFHERFLIARDRLKRSYPAGCQKAHEQDRGRSMPRDENEWATWISSAHA